MASRKVIAAAAGKTPRAAVMSPVKSLAKRTVVTDDPVLTAVQEDVRRQNDQLLRGTPFREGAVLTVDFNDGLIQVLPHHLGGKAGGFIVCDLQSASLVGVTIYREDVDPAQQDTHISFRATLACEAKIWVWR